MHDNNPSECGSNSSNCHTDFIETECSPNVLPAINNVIERNTERNNAGPDAHAWLAQDAGCSPPSSHLIIRFNDLAHVGSYGLLDQLGAFTFVKDYNNNYVDFGNNGFGESTNAFGDNSTNGSEINTIFYYPQTQNSAPYNVYNGGGTGFTAGANLAFCTGTCTLRGRNDTGTFGADAPGNLFADPLFVNYGGNDFHLQATSPARGAGRNLTTAVGSGSSTSLTVADAAFFQDGYGIAGVQADWIRIGASTTVQILSINYSTNVITLASAVSWSNGDAIYLYKDSSGSAVLLGSLPDIGAYQYQGAGGGSAPAPPTMLSAVPR
jgi:hypothetical protein